MPSRIKAVSYLGGHRLQLTFTDGAAGEVDLRDWIVNRGGVFEPLEDVEVFRQVRVNPELETIVWPNGVDFCPDVLHQLATGEPLGGQAREQSAAEPTRS